jgi:hypothetical protein
VSCLMWSLWRERKDISFDDHERKVVELKSLFSILFTIDFFNVPNFVDFLSCPSYGFLLYIFCVLGLHLCTFWAVPTSGT